MVTRIALFDLIPISSGSADAAALRNTVGLARQAERFGYRYWFAEHHRTAVGGRGVPSD